MSAEASVGRDDPFAAGIVPVERVGWRRGDPPEDLVGREWLVTNGLGGYAAGTIGGVPTRRYHGLLVAALPAPRGRVMTVSHLVETLRLGDGTVLPLSGLEPAPGPLALPEALAELRVINGRPRWRFVRDGLVLERSVTLPHRRNTTHVSYALVRAPGPVTLVLEPALSIRPHDGLVAGEPGGYELREMARGVAVTLRGAGERFPPVYLEAFGPTQVPLIDDGRVLDLLYRVEQARGYDCRGVAHVVGRFEIPLSPGAGAALTVSTERVDEAYTLSPTYAGALDDQRRLRLVQQADPRLRDGLAAELVLAADQFVITPHVRPADEARLQAVGDDARTVIAGYPWFTDWGRDTMISLEGLTLLTGRQQEARDILHTFAGHIRDGLIPNLFPEGESGGVYHTADATLWFFHAVDRYEQVTGERETRRALLPRLVDIIDKHVVGTRFGIHVDPRDGLLYQGADGYQLTWMDAKVGDWVVTPRGGKAVEINALFYNALRLLERWLREDEEHPDPARAAEQRSYRLHGNDVATLASTVHRSFNERFWYADGGYLYDVVDGLGADARPDASLRPNQLLAISLPNPVLDQARWEPVVRTVQRELVTPFGLRTLSRAHPDYKPRYDGDLRARDAAYHQGTVWVWLLGPFIDAWLKTFPDDRAGARAFLEGLDRALTVGAVGTIPEIFDAEPPFRPRGCVAQAWSVAEALRALALVAG
jgi:predicted glycogen debranching enzyme